MKICQRSIRILSTAALVFVIGTGSRGGVAVAGAAEESSARSSEGSVAGQDFEEDPWEPFNEGMFSFNRQFDRTVVKPVATIWEAVLPDLVRRSLGNALDNLAVVRRVVNNLLQLKLEGAAREMVRFTVNS